MRNEEAKNDGKHIQQNYLKEEQQKIMKNIIIVGDTHGLEFDQGYKIIYDICQIKSAGRKSKT